MLHFFGIHYKIDEISGCWTATSHKTNKGGYIYINRIFKRGYAHRLIYEKKKGPVKPDDRIKHTCKNKICLNPNHLYIL